MNSAKWFIISFLASIGILFATANILSTDGTPPESSVSVAPTDIRMPTTGLIDAATGEAIDNGPTYFDGETRVILLGAIGCYPNQPEVLRWWEARLDSIPALRIVALVADPGLGVNQNRYDAVVLKRVSQATFPFLVSTGADFDLRWMRVPLPQVVDVVDGNVVRVVEPPPQGFPGVTNPL